MLTSLFINPLLNRNYDLRRFQKLSRILVMKTVLMCARHVLYIETLLRVLQAGIKNTSPFIKNIARLSRKSLSSFIQVSTVTHNYSAIILHGYSTFMLMIRYSKSLPGRGYDTKLGWKEVPEAQITSNFQTPS